MKERGNVIMQKKIKANLLETGLYFQKDPNPKRIQKIVDEFTWNLFRPLDVSKRDGHFYVLDGQHRLFAIRQMNGVNSEINIPCNVIEGLTEKEECKLFVELNTSSRKVSPMEIAKGNYAGGKGDFAIVDMYNKINKNGLILDFETARKNGRIIAIKTISNIYEEITDCFDEYIEIISKTWGGDTKSLQVPILKGVCEFLKRYHDTYKKDIFIRKLSKYSPDDIVREGKADLLDKTEIGCGKSIFAKYNKGLKQNNRLESRW